MAEVGLMVESAHLCDSAADPELFKGGWPLKNILVTIYFSPKIFE